MSLFVRRVVGDSMSPTLLAGNIVVGLTKGRYRSGRIVIAKVGDREVIKRIDAIKNKKYFLKGDNAAASTDSRHYGAVSESAILGVIIMKVHFVTSVNAPKPVYPRLLFVPYVLAASLIAILLTSLFYFERLATFIQQNFSFDSALLMPKVYSILFVLSLLFSLPFLLRMTLSPLARFCSALMVLNLPVLSMVSVILYELYGDNSGGVAMMGFSIIGILALASFHILNGRQALQGLAKRI